MKPLHLCAALSLVVVLIDYLTIKYIFFFLRWTKSAPKRTVTVRDTMSDLPKVCNYNTLIHHSEKLIKNKWIFFVQKEEFLFPIHAKMRHS